MRAGGGTRAHNAPGGGRRRAEMAEQTPCSLCGRETEFEIGGAVAAWYLCADCECTDAAREAGFTHEE